ncbi:MAG: hypothetical protein ACOYNG_08720, partial [Terrimicrobiaceae bacterium]
MISRKSLFLAVGAAISILLPACKPPAPAESKPEAAPAASPAPTTEAAAPAAESEAVSAVTEPVSLETAGTAPEAPQAESSAKFKPIELPEVVAKVNGQDIPRS